MPTKKCKLIGVHDPTKPAYILCKIDDGQVSYEVSNWNFKSEEGVNLLVAGKTVLNFFNNDMLKRIREESAGVNE